MTRSKKAKALAMFNMIAVVACVLAFSAIAAMAQATTGTLRGVVADASGALVPGATVTIKNEATGATSSATTTNEGVFEATNLAPGTYAVTVEATNFKRSVNTGVQVKVGIVNPVDVKLEAGNVAETVTVTASTEEVVNRDQSQIAATIESRRVSELPTNGAGGGIDTLALLIPGVIANRSGGTNTNGTGLSVNGNRGRSNNFQIDGSDNNDLSVGGPALFVDFTDAVQEFQVITNNFSAQYGRNQGAVVNIVTKGGTNDFHGSLFWYHQDARNLNTLNNQERAGGQLQPNRNLYNVPGGTVGGPVFLPRFGEGGKSLWSGRNKAFFFVAYQGIRNPATATGRSATLAILNGDFARLSATYPGNNVISAITTYSPFAIPGAVPRDDVGGGVFTSFNLAAPAGCPRAIAFGSTPPAGCVGYTTPINPSTGAPFLTGGPYDVVNFGTTGAPVLFQAAQPQRTLPASYTENYYSFRFDVKPTSKDSGTFRFLKQVGVNTNGIGTFSTGITGDIPAGSKNFGGNYTRQINNAMVNDFRASYQIINVEFGGGCKTGAPSCIPGPTDIGRALANISFPQALGVTKTSAASNPLTTLGPATNLPQGRIGKVYQYADNLNWSRGQHSFLFGFEYKHLIEVVPFLPNFNGVFQYSNANCAPTPAACRIINNTPSAYAVTIGDPTLAFKENDEYAFVQDDWRIRPNLTLNLGVRYEYTGQPINQLNDVTVARESSPATALFNPALPISVRTVPRVAPDKNNFAPRVGFAWSPHFWKGILGEDATVIRGGFSIAYDAAFYNILLNIQNASPFAAAINVPTSLLVGNPGPPPGTIVAPLTPDPTGTGVRAAAPGRGILDPRLLTRTDVASDFRSPYSEQFSLGVQHQFGRNQVAEVRYVGTHGVGLFQNLNGNFYVGPILNGFTLTRNGITRTFPGFASQLPAGTVEQVCVDNPATLDIESACNRREFKQGSVTTRANTSQSIYHSMQSRYNGRFFNNALTLGAAYTWSKTIDDSSEIFAQTDVLSANAQNPYCRNRCERSLSALDRPHAFSTNFLFDLPYFREQRGVAGHFLGGWQINGTYILTSGATFTPGQSFSGATLGTGATYLTTGDRPFLTNPNVDPRLVGINAIDLRFFTSAAFPAGTAPGAGPAFGPNDNIFYSLNAFNANGAFVPVTLDQVHFVYNGPGSARFFGTPFGTSTRNSLRGPIFNSMNLGLFKNIKIGERFTLQLRGEAFNALNHPNPGFGVERIGANYLPNINVQNAGLPFANGSAFDEFTHMTFARRVLQFGARITF